MNSNVISYHALRQLIGVLGMLLPWMCWCVNAFINDFDLLNNPLFVDVLQSKNYQADLNLKSSISHFYYTAAGPLFTGILTTVAIFLFCYKGYEVNEEHDRFAWLTDNKLATFAAICALGIVVFPTDSKKLITDNIHIYVSSKGAGTLHLIFAASFFLSMAILSIVNFRRQPNKMLITNAEGKLYLVCGWGMISCLLILAFYNFNSLSWLPYWFVFALEAVMLTLFGIAWLVKGKSVPTEYVLKQFVKQN